MMGGLGFARFGGFSAPILFLSYAWLDNLQPILFGVVITIGALSGLEIPLITGGGIRNPEAAYAQARAGSDLLIVGNSLEQDPSLLRELSKAVTAAGNAEAVAQRSGGYQVPSSKNGNL